MNSVDFGSHSPNKAQRGAGQLPSSGPEDRGPEGRAARERGERLGNPQGTVALQEQTREQIQAES